VAEVPDFAVVAHRVSGELGFHVPGVEALEGPLQRFRVIMLVAAGRRVAADLHLAQELLRPQAGLVRGENTVRDEGHAARAALPAADAVLDQVHPADQRG
jgi:hypothetical protein